MEKAPYKDSRTQALLNRFFAGKLKEIVPIFDLERGFVYADVEAILGDSAGVAEFLENLHKAGILNRELYDMAVLCPKCGSANVSIHYSCPFCRSFDIKKSSLIEHIKCGYMDVEEKFRSDGGLVCPKCNMKLAKLDLDYRMAGVWCTCNTCGKSFDIPVPQHFCRLCRYIFAFEEAVFKEAYAYTLNEKGAEHMAIDWTVFAQMKSLMEERGFNVETPGFVVGRSGVRHRFDLVAWGKGEKRKIIAVNVALSQDGKTLSDQPIIDIFAKSFDSNVDEAFLIAMPEVNESGRKLANLYKIHVVEARTLDEAFEKLRRTLPLK